MNAEPAQAVRVSHELIHQFVFDAVTAAGMPEHRASLLADLLTAGDLRGVFSHGSQLLGWYTQWMVDGTLNLDPQITTVRESPTSLMLDGDNGLGYFPMWEGTQRVIEKAKQSGIAVLGTYHHEHIGSAGHYVRPALEQDMVAFATTGHQLRLNRLEAGKRKHMIAGGGSAMAFGAPAEEQPDFVLDFGAMHDLYSVDTTEKLMEIAPGLVMRTIGLGEVTQIFGGLLMGLPAEADRNPRNAQGPRELEQGGMVIVMRIDLFTDPATFRREIDSYSRQVHELIPHGDMKQAMMPGEPEAERVERYKREGVPIGEKHQKTIDKVCERLGIRRPW